MVLLEPSVYAQTTRVLCRSTASGPAGEWPPPPEHGRLPPASIHTQQQETDRDTPLADHRLH